MALLKLGVSLWVLLLLGVGRSVAEEEELVEAGEDLGEEEGRTPTRTFWTTWLSRTWLGHSHATAPPAG